LTSAWKPVADADDQAAAIDELQDPVGEMDAQLVREEPARGDVVAVGEAARHREDAVVVEERGSATSLRTCTSSGCAPWRANACAVSTSQLMPGARRPGHGPG
jgi:hypothetical protein